MAEGGHEEPKLTRAEVDAAIRLGIRWVSFAALIYLAMQLAHEAELLPDFIDFSSFETPWWKVALIVWYAGLIAGGQGKRKDTTPNP